ncbi:MAG TPA: prolipoprotein diacylglyceryl transferase family protein [Anaerolineales bacterium]
MLPFIRVGPLLVQLPGLALLAGIWIGINLAEKEALRLRLNASAIVSMTMYGLIGGVIGARLLYALEHLDAYAAAPLSLLALSTTALDGWGGLVVGAIVGFLYGRKHHLPLRPSLDSLAPAVAVFMIALAVANLLSGNGYGASLDAPWAIFIWGEYRHPTQVYEILLALGVFLAWRLAPAGDVYSGNSFWQVVGLSAAARVLTEAFHGDSAHLILGFRLVQVVALALLGTSMLVGRRWSAAAAAPA